MSSLASWYLPGNEMPSGRGQLIQVPRRRYHSAGKEKPCCAGVPLRMRAFCAPGISVVEALGQRPVRVDAPIAQERPVSAAEFDLREIAVDDHHAFLVDRRALDHLSIGRGDERLPPEHDAVLVDRLALGVR